MDIIFTSQKSMWKNDSNWKNISNQILSPHLGLEFYLNITISLYSN
jgi:hypothetical protein